MGDDFEAAKTAPMFRAKQISNQEKYPAEAIYNIVGTPSAKLCKATLSTTDTQSAPASESSPAATSWLQQVQQKWERSFASRRLWLRPTDTVSDVAIRRELALYRRVTVYALYGGAARNSQIACARIERARCMHGTDAQMHKWDLRGSKCPDCTASPLTIVC